MRLADDPAVEGFVKALTSLICYASDELEAKRGTTLSKKMQSSSMMEAMKMRQRKIQGVVDGMGGSGVGLLKELF
jgi:hypothetical protein